MEPGMRNKNQENIRKNKIIWMQKKEMWKL